MRLHHCSVSGSSMNQHRQPWPFYIGVWRANARFHADVPTLQRCSGMEMPFWLAVGLFLCFLSHVVTPVVPAMNSQ